MHLANYRNLRLPIDSFNEPFYFPIVTCLLVSIAISLLFWLLTR